MLVPAAAQRFGTWRRYHILTYLHECLLASWAPTQSCSPVQDLTLARYLTIFEMPALQMTRPYFYSAPRHHFRLPGNTGALPSYKSFDGASALRYLVGDLSPQYVGASSNRTTQSLRQGGLLVRLLVVLSVHLVAYSWAALGSMDQILADQNTRIWRLG